MRYVLVALPDSNTPQDDYNDMFTVASAMDNGHDDSDIAPHDVPPFITMGDNETDRMYYFMNAHTEG